MEYYDEDALINVVIDDSYYQPNLDISNVAFRETNCPIKIVSGYLTGDRDHTRAYLSNVVMDHVNIGMDLDFNGTIYLDRVDIHDSDIAFFLPPKPSGYVYGTGLVVYNNDCGFASPPASGQGTSKTIHLLNCTFVNNQDWDIYGNRYLDGQPAYVPGYDIKNSMFAYSGGFLGPVVYPFNNEQYNLYFQLTNGIDDNDIGEGTLNNVDPKFTDVSNSDFTLQSTSPCIDAGDPDPQYNDPDGTRNDIGAYYYPQLQGEITEDTQWSNQMSIVGNVTVLEGVTLTIEPGTEILVNQSKKITVNGILEAQGESTDPITFTRSDPESNYNRFWQGIYINSSGQFSLDHVYIYGAYRGVYSNYADGSIKNSHFEENYFSSQISHSDNISINNSQFVNNKYGPYFMYSSGANIGNNTFMGNRYGLIFNRSSGTLSGNTIKDNSYYGVYCTNISNPNLSTIRETEHSNYYVNNTIENNSYTGVYINYNSSPNLGIYLNIVDIVFGGFNHFNRSNGSYDVRSYNSNTIFAEVNWWGMMNNYGNVNNDPTATSLFGPLSKTIAHTSGYSQDSLDTLLIEAYILEVVDSAYVEAINLYNDIIHMAPGDSIVYTAISGIARNFNHMQNVVGLIDNLDELYEEYPDNLAGIAAHDFSVTIDAHRRNFTGALLRSEEVINTYVSMKSDEEEAWAILELALIYEALSDSQSALQKIRESGTSLAQAEGCYQRIMGQYPYTEAAEFVYDLYGIEAPEITEVNLPERFSLKPAYPNPFNPITTISFDVIEVSDVTLIIYDLLGREIMVLVDTEKQPGFHQSIWNGLDHFGKPVSSGIYIYKITANSQKSEKQFAQSRKMVLLK